MNSYLLYVQIAVSIVLVVLIALQQRGTALGGAFGGSGEFYSQRRGIQKKIFYATVVTAALFVMLGILGLIIQ